MGRIAKFLSFVRFDRNGAKGAEVKLDPGGGQNITTPHFSAPGDDSFPLPQDIVATTIIPGSGKEAAIGYSDTLNAGITVAGEKRIYGRDADGVIVNSFHLKADGSVLLSNAEGFASLGAEGTFNINGVTIDKTGEVKVGGLTIAADGTLTSTKSIESDVSLTAPSAVANGKELAGHNHPITSGSSAPGPTGPNN